MENKARTVLWKAALFNAALLSIGNYVNHKRAQEELREQRFQEALASQVTPSIDISQDYSFPVKEREYSSKAPESFEVHYAIKPEEVSILPRVNFQDTFSPRQDKSNNLEATARQHTPLYRRPLRVLPCNNFA